MLKIAINIVRRSLIVPLPISKQTAIMTAIEATLTASKKAGNNFKVCIFLTSGFSKATKINEGKNIPIVEMSAPENPFIL